VAIRGRSGEASGRKRDRKPACATYLVSRVAVVQLVVQRRHGELVFLAQSPEQRGVALSRTARRELTGEELVYSLARHAGQRAEQRGGDAEGQRQQRVRVHGERHRVDHRGLGDHPRHLGDARHRFKMLCSASFSRCSLANAAANADAGEPPSREEPRGDGRARRGRFRRSSRGTSPTPGRSSEAPRRALWPRARRGFHQNSRALAWRNKTTLRGKTTPSWHNERRRKKRKRHEAGVESRPSARSARRFAERQGTKTRNGHEKTFGNDAGDVGESGRVANDSRCGHAGDRRRATRSFVFVEKLRLRFCRMHTSRATTAFKSPLARTGARVPARSRSLSSFSSSPPSSRHLLFSPSWRRPPAPPWRRRGLPAPSWTPPRRRSSFSQTLRCRTSGACRRRRAWRARRARC